MGLKSCIIVMIELFKVCSKNQLSDNVSNHWTVSCNPTSRKLKSCNHCCVRATHVLQNSHNLFPSIFHKGSYDCKHKTCILNLYSKYKKKQN